MKGYSLTYEPDGTQTYAEYTSRMTLEALQKAVGGYIETVPGFTFITREGVKHEGIAFCNEKGKFEGLPINEQATDQWKKCLGVESIDDVLVGNVIFVWGDNEFMGLL